MVERLRLRQLAWRSERDRADLAADIPGSFDVIVGADVVYNEGAVPDLFSCCKQLLKCTPQVCTRFPRNSRACMWGIRKVPVCVREDAA